MIYWSSNNSELNNPNNDLHPQYSIATGLPIPNSPKTPVVLADLDAALSTRFLELLARIKKTRVAEIRWDEMLQ
jgi:hypothetical protein